MPRILVSLSWYVSLFESHSFLPGGNILIIYECVKRWRNTYFKYCILIPKNLNVKIFLIYLFLLVLVFYESFYAALTILELAVYTRLAFHLIASDFQADIKSVHSYSQPTVALYLSKLYVFACLHMQCIQM